MSKPSETVGRKATGLFGSEWQPGYRKESFVMRRWLPLGLTLVILLALSPPVRAQAAVFNVDSNQGSVQVILEE